MIGWRRKKRGEVSVASRPIHAPAEREDRWRDRRWLARLIRWTILLIPIAISFLFALAVTVAWDAYESLWKNIGRWIAIAIASTILLLILQRVAKRFLPLSTMLSLTLIFPDQAPSRFGLALRTGTTRQLARKIEEIEQEGLGDTPAEAAEMMLELVGDLSRHDRLTRGHSERVRAYSRMIGEEMELPPQRLDLLHWAGLVHDVGKIYVPDEILNKNGSLTDEEFDVIKAHTVNGQRLVEPLADWLGPAAAAVWGHHERWEGGGYPTGAPSSETPIEARIVCVADAFDVMTSARSYKKPMSATRARAELERCAGTQFDPDVVRAMLSISLGRLWSMMGPLSLIAQIRLFPRQLVQGGTTAAAVVAAILGLFMTTIAGGLPWDTAAGEAPQEVLGEFDDAGAEPEPEPAPVSDPVIVVAPSTSTTTTSTTTSSTTSTSTTTSSTTSTTTSSTTSTTTSTTVPTVVIIPTTTVVPTTTSTTTTTTTTTTATTSTTTTTVPLAPAWFVLASSGAGDVASSPVLDLASRAPINPAGVPNYDVDRDSDPGLTIERSDAALDSSSPTQRQVWRAPDTVRELAGPIRLQIWFAPASDLGDGFAVSTAGLYDCAASGGDCKPLAVDAGVFTAPAGTFTGVSFDLTPAGGTTAIAAGRVIEARVAVPVSSASDLWLAYDSTTYPATIAFG